MLHFVKQFKRKKTTFENFFVQKTNAEYTVMDNTQEAFPEKPCGRAVKTVVPCLLKKKFCTFQNPHLRKTAVGKRATDNAQEAFPEKPCGRAVKTVVPCLLKKNFALFKTHTYGKRATDKGVFEKRPVFNLRYVPFPTCSKHSYILKG